jgi:hypothetical protein
MAAIVSTRILALQATSPRIVAVPLPTNVTVDLSNTSQALNNLPSYTRVSGVTALATQSTLANGGGYLTGFGSVSSQNSLAFGGAYLTGFGAVASQSSLPMGRLPHGLRGAASQSTVNLASQITGSLANSNVSGLGALALLGSVALDGVYVVNNLAATRIGAGTIAAGVIYAGDIAASQITSGYIAAARINAGTLEVGKLQSATSATMAANTTFGLGTRWDADSGGSGGYTGVVGRASSASTFGGAFTQSATNGYAPDRGGNRRVRRGGGLSGQLDCGYGDARQRRLSRHGRGSRVFRVEPVSDQPRTLVGSRRLIQLRPQGRTTATRSGEPSEHPATQVVSAQARRMPTPEWWSLPMARMRSKCLPAVVPPSCRVLPATTPRRRPPTP